MYFTRKTIYIKLYCKAVSCYYIFAFNSKAVKKYKGLYDQKIMGHLLNMLKI